MARRLWAIARVTIAQGLRMKVAIVVILFLLVLIPTLPLVLKTDNTVAGRVRLTVTYTTYLVLFLMAILTIFLSASAISREIEARQIFVLDPKPVPRWQVFLGKWLGIMVLNTGLLLVLGAASYGLLRYMTRDEAIRTLRDYGDLRFRFWVARGVATPALDYDPIAEADKKVDEWIEKGLLPKSRSRKWSVQHMIPIVQRERNSVKAMDSKVWRFEGLPTRLNPNLPLQFRFRHFVTHRPENSKVRGQWLFINPDRKLTYPVPPPADMPGATPHEGYTADVYHEINIPAGLIAKDGSLTVRYINVEPGAPTVIFPYDKGLQLFYPVGSLEANYARAYAAILIILGFIAVMGLTCGAGVGYPVAVLAALTVFLIGANVRFLDSFVQGMYLFGPDIRQPGAEFSKLDMAIQGLLRGFLWLFPPLMDYSPVRRLADAEVVSLGHLGRAFVWLGLVRGGIVALLGALIFHSREVGAAVGE